MPSLTHTHRLSRAITGVLIALTACLSTACERRPLFFAYQPTDIEGWEPADTLRFHIDTIAHSGSALLSLYLRTSATGSYPYTSIWLAVRTRLHRPDTVFTDTVECKLLSDTEAVRVNGISRYQHSRPLRLLSLDTASTMDVDIVHLMRRDMLPGVADVGLRLDPQP